MCLAAEWAGGLYDLRHAAPIGRMVAREPAAVGIDRQPSAAEQSAVLDEPPAAPLLAESEVFEGDEDRDGERVVQRRVLDVARRHTGLGECKLSRSAGRGVGKVDSS